MDRSLFDVYDRNEALNSLIEVLSSFITSYNTNMNSLINEYNTNTRSILSLVEHLINITTRDINNNINSQPRNPTYRRNTNQRRNSTTLTSNRNMRNDDSVLLRERTTTMIDDIEDDRYRDNFRRNVQESENTTLSPRRNRLPPRQPYVRLDRQYNGSSDALREIIRSARDIGTRTLTSLNDSLIIPNDRNDTRNRILTEDRTNVFQMDALTELISNQIANLQDVPVFPTNEQIQQATVDYLYSDSPNLLGNEHPDRCPITMDYFEEGDEVSRIIYCGHVFKKSALIRWFSNNVRCPVCRYDIREYNPRNNNSDNDLSLNDIPLTGSNLTRTTSDNSIVSPVFAANVYSFDIPIIIGQNTYDLSDNNV